MREIEALCRRSVAVARHSRLTALRRFNAMMPLLDDASALHLRAVTMPRCYDALVARHSDGAIFRCRNIAQFQLRDATALRFLSAVIV